MARNQPYQIIGYHSCDRELALDVLVGKKQLKQSENAWDWLGGGIYFWEQDPRRAFDYAKDVADGRQYNKKKIKTPFIIGANIRLGNCLNLVESESLSILEVAHAGLKKLLESTGQPMPLNDGPKRHLDCAVLKYVHQSRVENDDPPYDTIRSAFDEGQKVYPGASFTSRHHIQVCVLNPEMIQGYFLPLPAEEFNPYLDQEFIPASQ